MQTVKEAWSALNAGNAITNGELELTYLDGFLTSVEGVPFHVIPFDADNIEEWDLVHEAQQMYCKWYYEDPDGVTLSDKFFRVEIEPQDGWLKHKMQYSIGEIL